MMNPVAEVEHAGLSERADLTFSTSRSAEFHGYARQYAPLGVIGGGRYWRPYPLCMAKAKGSYPGTLTATDILTTTRHMVPQSSVRTMTRFETLLWMRSQSGPCSLLFHTKRKFSCARKSRSFSLRPRR